MLHSDRYKWYFSINFHFSNCEWISILFYKFKGHFYIFFVYSLFIFLIFFWWILDFEFFFFILWLHLWDMEVARLGLESERPLRPKLRILQFTGWYQTHASAATWATTVEFLIHCAIAGTLVLQILRALFVLETLALWVDITYFKVLQWDFLSLYTALGVKLPKILIWNRSVSDILYIQSYTAKIMLFQSLWQKMN